MQKESLNEIHEKYLIKNLGYVPPKNQIENINKNGWASVGYESLAFFLDMASNCDFEFENIESKTLNEGPMMPHTLKNDNVSIYEAFIVEGFAKKDYIKIFTVGRDIYDRPETVDDIDDPKFRRTIHVGLELKGRKDKLQFFKSMLDDYIKEMGFLSVEYEKLN
ncbi:hypothetical protein C0585_02835 [Candidatus Woesearchaeota archaeon]|nr:MAG: hypothetical protein C0585_02835 [Candidatus Woesearchaeota archaeon]